MKKLSFLLAGLVWAGSAFGLVTQKTNTVNLVLADVCDGNFRDFKFQLSGYDDQVFNFNYDQSLAGVACSFRITKPMDGTIYLDVSVTDITVSGTNATFSIARTNIPPPGNYYGELLSYEATSTNYYRSIAQGTLPVTWSLYLNASNFFARSTNEAGVGQVYVHPNWIDPPWYGTNSGLGSIYVTIANYDANNVLQRNTNTVFHNYDTAQTATNAEFESRIAAEEALSIAQALTNALKTDIVTFNASNALLQTAADYGISAYAWGDHSLAGYLSATTNRFDSVRVGNESLTTTNLSTLTSTYTGVVATAGIAYTGTVDVTDGRLYMAGYTKQNAFGSVTMSVAGLTLHSTASGANSNYFAAMGTATTNVIVAIYGNGASKSDVSSVYVKQITNGSVYIADDLYVGDNIYGADNLVLTNDPVYLAAITNNTLTESISNSYAKVGRVGQFTTRTNYEAVGVAAAVAGNLTSVSNAVDVLETNTFPMQSGLSVSNDLDTTEANVTAISNAVDIIETNYFPLQLGINVSNDLDTTELNVTSISNDLDIVETNTFPLQSGLNVSNRVVTIEGYDSISDYSITDAYTKVESDAAYAPTGTVGAIDTRVGTLEGQTNSYLTNEPFAIAFSNANQAKITAALTNETYVGTITGGTVTAGAADTFIVTGPNAAVTWDTNAAGGGGAGSGFPLSADGDLAGYTLSNGVLSNVTYYGDGVGMTNVPGTETGRIAFHGESGVVMRVDSTNVYLGAPDLATKATVTIVSNAAIAYADSVGTVVSNASDAGDIIVSNAALAYADSVGTVVSNAALAYADSVGAIVSNAALAYADSVGTVVSNAYTNTAALAAAALSTNGGRMNADINMGGQAVTNADDVKDAAGFSMLVPVGGVIQYISSNAPAGWLLCNGAAVGTNVYPALFAVIGLQYGGATTNMNLPDLQGRVPVGMGSGAGLTARHLSSTGGVETVQLSTDQIPAHQHATYVRDDVSSLGAGSASVVGYVNGSTINKFWGGEGITGGDGAHANMPPFIVINYIIKH